MNMDTPKKVFQIPIRIYLARFINAPPSTLGKILWLEGYSMPREFKDKER